ncbi:L-rhamnose mutarotase [Salinibacterium sp.]|uniref:L-rhamnose mutarotase n=1 Tax=Salinibacterium sp. TaxID=1915057 RepID=UPI00286AE301|nr:L-rhamnose mutarotase [Salinibacterium sp.]
MAERVCFRLQVRPERLGEYRARHANVPREMLEAIEDSGRRNYSLFLHDDGTLIGYYDTDSVEASQTALSTDPRTTPWEFAMADFFVALDGRPDQSATTLPEIFNLHDQLSKDA